MSIYKLIPASKSYIWGGRRLINDYNKPSEADTLSECWELSFHPDGLTLLNDGRPLSSVLDKSALGSNLDAFDSFPQLIKLIDAGDKLSVQVHPDDEYARLHENSYGKTEMWYVVDTAEGAGIYLGFNRDVTPSQFKNAIDTNTLTELLNFYPVKKGECYFIPAGTIHAIAKGCLICEVQQNSNITYRVYDYGRVDANGNPRELHVDKALEVTCLDKFEHSQLSVTTDSGDMIALSKYFTVKKIDLSGTVTLSVDSGSFKYAVCLDGECRLGEVKLKKGESVLITAGSGDITLSGNATVVTSEVRKYYIGIDLGGTFIKGGIVDDVGNIIVSEKAPTEADKGHNQVNKNIANLCKRLCESVGLTLKDTIGIGMGVPGTVDSVNGTVIYSNNLNWHNFEIAGELTALTGLPVKIANDANVAALGETVFGCGKDFKTTVMLTLGTGVGGGVVIDGKLYQGNLGAGAEMGHAVIVAGGEKCTCGRRGCLEAYASATALIRDTKRAMQNNSDSKMWELGSVDNVDGSTAFKYRLSDSTAKTVVDNYIEKLGCGIVNLANEFRPEAIILGGGVCNEGDNLVVPLQKILDREIFGGNNGPSVKIITAKLGNRAGTLGAAALWF